TSCATSSRGTGRRPRSDSTCAGGCSSRKRGCVRSCSPKPRDDAVLIWEVFRQEKKGAPFTHAGSVVAPDATFAQAFAHEQYGRRQESVALWVVPRDAVHEVTDFHDELEKTYHRVDGYSLKAKLKQARERANTAA